MTDRGCLRNRTRVSLAKGSDCHIPSAAGTVVADRSGPRGERTWITGALVGMNTTDFAKAPAARKLALSLGSINHQSNSFRQTHGRMPLQASGDSGEATLADSLAHAEELALQTARAKRAARQIVATMFTVEV